jgi:hypothetical protein
MRKETKKEQLAMRSLALGRTKLLKATRIDSIISNNLLLCPIC